MLRAVGPGGVGEPRPLDHGERLRAYMLALLGPLLGLADEHRADEAMVATRIREDAYHIPTSADLLVQELLEGSCSKICPFPHLLDSLKVRGCLAISSVAKLVANGREGRVHGRGVLSRVALGP
jgi:hypothetical protein